MGQLSLIYVGRKKTLRGVWGGGLDLVKIRLTQPQVELELRLSLAA
jgi:hypothetical protein